MKICCVMIEIHHLAENGQEKIKQTVIVWVWDSPKGLCTKTLVILEAFERGGAHEIRESSGD